MGPANQNTQTKGTPGPCIWMQAGVVPEKRCKNGVVKV